MSEGKNDPIYRIPSYHMKVPPKAIEKYLLHYTDPGDIVLDGFSGSGMDWLSLISYWEKIGLSALSFQLLISDLWLLFLDLTN